MSDKKRYLGDSVYVDMVNDMVCLTTDNGYGPRDTIYLEESVIVGLIDWWDKIVAESN